MICMTPALHAGLREGRRQIVVPKLAARFRRRRHDAAFKGHKELETDNNVWQQANMRIRHLPDTLQDHLQPRKIQKRSSKAGNSSALPIGRRQTFPQDLLGLGTSHAKEL